MKKGNKFPAKFSDSGGKYHNTITCNCEDEFVLPRTKREILKLKGKTPYLSVEGHGGGLAFIMTDIDENGNVQSM